MPGLNFRSYVALDGDPGVYGFSLDTGSRAAAILAPHVFGLPVTAARMSARRAGDAIVFRSRRAGDPAATFGARYRPTGEPGPAAPDTLAAFCIERDRYFFPAGEDRRPVGGAEDGTIRVGRITREPWTIRPVEATIRTNGLCAAAGVPEPGGEPSFHYSPGFEMGVEPQTSRAVADGRPS